MNASAFDETQLYTYAYNIKMRMDVQMTNLRNQIAADTEELKREVAKQKYNEKMLAEMQVQQAVYEHSKQEAETQIRQLSEQLSAIRMEMNEIRFTKVDEQLAESKELLASLQEQQTQEEALVADCRKQEEAQKERLMQLRLQQAENEKQLAELLTKEQAFEEAAENCIRYRQFTGHPRWKHCRMCWQIVSVMRCSR